MIYPSMANFDQKNQKFEILARYETDYTIGPVECIDTCYPCQLGEYIDKYIDQLGAQYLVWAEPLIKYLPI